MSTTVLLLFLLVFLVFLSIVESVITRLTRLSLKVLAEKHPSDRYRLLDEIAGDRRGVLLPLQFGIQLVLIAITILLTSVFINLELEQSLTVSFAFAVLVVVLFRQVIPRILAVISPKRLLLAFLPVFSVIYRILKILSLPIYWATEFVDKRRVTSNHLQEEEASEEEIQAYLGVGEEEGIFEGNESQLLQSALEFRSTLVREIMTPRDEITAIEENATASELKKLIVEEKHSRIPVYREQLDQIVGVVYVRNLLAYLETGKDQDPITPIIAEVTIVPETKRVPVLLEEMQSRAEQLALVVNEYGTISGLVTIEDLLEEIVGEIRDEDEMDQVDLLDEGHGSFVVQGGAEVEDLEDALGLSFGEREAATVSGLVVDHLGRVPNPGEKVVMEDALIEVINADHKRINTMRVRHLKEMDKTSLSRTD